MAFRRASKTKKVAKIKAKLKSHHFRGKINWFKPQKKKLKESSRRAQGLFVDDSRADDTSCWWINCFRISGSVTHVHVKSLKLASGALVELWSPADIWSYFCCASFVFFGLGVLCLWTVFLLSVVAAFCLFVCLCSFERKLEVCLEGVFWILSLKCRICELRRKSWFRDGRPVL